MDAALVKQLKARVEEELHQREVALLEYWVEEVQKIEAKRHQDLAGLHSDVMALSQRMQNRLKALKTAPKR